MKVTKNAFGIVLLVAIALIGAIVLVALAKPVPEFVSLIAITGLGAIAGVTVPDTSGVTSSVDLSGLGSIISAELAKLTAPAAVTPAVGTTPAVAPMVQQVPAATITTSYPVPAATPATDAAPAFAPAAVPPSA